MYTQHLNTNVHVCTNRRLVNQIASLRIQQKKTIYLQNSAADGRVKCNLLTNAGNTDFANHHISIQDVVVQETVNAISSLLIYTVLADKKTGLSNNRKVGIYMFFQGWWKCQGPSESIILGSGASK